MKLIKDSIFIYLQGDLCHRTNLKLIDLVLDITHVN